MAGQPPQTDAFLSVHFIQLGEPHLPSPTLDPRNTHFSTSVWGSSAAGRAPEASAEGFSLSAFPGVLCVPFWAILLD